MVKTLAFILSGITAAIGGVIMLGRLGLGDPIAGQGLGLDAVAAVVVGGTRLGGGRGTVWGTVSGALMLGIINNLFNLMNVSSAMQYMVRASSSSRPSASSARNRGRWPGCSPCSV